MRRQLWYAVTAAAVGAGFTLVAGSRVWAEIGITGDRGAPGLADPVTGSDELPWLSAVALAALAGAGALLATHGVLRVVVGAVLVLCGLTLVGAGGFAITDGARIWWPGLVALGGLLVLDAGALAIARGRHWPALGPRYERAPVVNARPAAGGSSAMWDALDRGEDPTG